MNAPASIRRQAEALSDPRIVIIGAGASGVLTGYRLMQQGLRNFIIYEKGDSVGGTWRENNYPGLHCDVPSHHYCYSFAHHPGWTKEYSSGPEIWRYFDRTARRLGVLPHIAFNSEVADAQWIDERWHVTLKDGRKDVADILISACGFLHKPSYPDIPGLADFRGTMFHTTRWDHAVPLTDKRIGVIGTGSTAIQIVAELSGKVPHLSLFQRTPQWVAKIANEPIPVWRRLLYRLLPHLPRRKYHDAMAITRAVTDGIMGNNPEARGTLEQNVRDNVASVRDPVLRAKLTPDYAVGCKRLIMSPNFYEAIQHPDTALVTERIDHIEQRGIVTADGTLHELDMLVLATGFDTSAYVRPMTMTGAGGRTLEQVWAKRPIAYHSMAVPYMPNFFMIAGPYGPFGNISVILMSEWQVDYIMKCIRLILSRGIMMAPRLDATERLVDRYREAAKSTTWATGGCTSWYLDSEGVPKIYPFTPTRFREETLVDPVLEDYEVAPLTRARSIASA